MTGFMHPVNLSCRFDPLGETYRSLQNADTSRSIIAEEAWRIRERYFPADVVFRVGVLDLSRVAVPVLDLAMSLEFAVKMLAMEGAAAVDSPGSSWRVGLERSGDAVTVSCGHDSRKSECSFADLAQAVGLFMRGTLDNLTEICPDLLLNDEIARLFRESGARHLGRDQAQRYARAVEARYRSV
ncbi:hypothetical protein [Yinghuangia soli]|uniref:Uncharacterized protein n=1 Tax=Yinghuangia soli TaxID=2908204 RepID=A0AA41PUJ4_9ACTN|nr:hypothetical protein [Yinghuangia soli]MCF2526129.1 hypothetical protein [Yinghuangia soli]